MSHSVQQSPSLVRSIETIHPRLRSRPNRARIGFSSSSLLLVLLLVASSRALASDGETEPAVSPTSSDEFADRPAEATVDLDLVLDEILIEARRESPLTGKIHSRYLTSTPSANLSEALVLLPGISAVGRGAKSLEPVVRGQGWERVATEVGCVPVYGACPARMDPPAVYIQPHAVETVEVSKGLGSLATGTDGIGGTIRIPTDYERAPHAPATLESFSSTAFDAVRSGFRIESGIRGGGAAYDLRASGAWSRFGDYDTPSGITVPASQEEMGASFSLGLRPEEGQRIYGSLDYTHGREVDFPSLPMDSRETDYVVGNIGYRWDRVAEH
ncbi:MAG: TonB-dependent receptor plug domain-containing protein, partial [Candidatus Eisenbacteria bacterium]